MSWNTRWAHLFYADQAKKDADARAERGRELQEQGFGDPLKDPLFVRLRLSEEVSRNMFLSSNMDILADNRRTRKHRNLGKQYGKASRTIRELRGEIALLQKRPTARALQRAQAARDAWQKRCAQATERLQMHEGRRVCTTADELLELPAGAVIKGPRGHLVERKQAPDGSAEWYHDGWRLSGQEMTFDAEQLVPARVLWLPSDEAVQE